MKIALFGGTGQVGTEVVRAAGRTGIEIDAVGRKRADFMHPDTVFEAVAALQADAIINAAAYTAVDKAESDAQAADTVNHVSVDALGRAAASIGVPVIHLSTDYVFSGEGSRPWRPDDPTGPLGIYGKSKLAGELALTQSGAQAVILRTAWVFSAHGGNFVKTMLRLAETKPDIPVVSDQTGSPTPAAAIAGTCVQLAKALADGAAGGTYHYAGAPDTSWAGFAREIFAMANRPTTVTEVPTSAFPTAATRPSNSRLDCSTLERDFGISRPDWKAGLADVLKELAA